MSRRFVTPPGILLIASSLDLAQNKNPKKVSLADWKASIGKEVGVSDWLLITQERVDAFATTTGDPQWIHGKDAKKLGSPFGGPIAHGFLVVSLAAYFGQQALPVLDGVKMGVNYGIDKLRFVSPVPVGKNARMRGTLVEVKELDGPMKGLQNTVRCSIEVEGAKKPSLVFDWLTRVYF
jgi:acyl dehydratase